MIELQLGDPVIGEGVLQRGEAGASVLTPAAPACAVVERARHLVEVALAVQQRNATPAGPFRIAVLVIGTDSQQGALADVGLENAVEDFIAALVVVGIGMLVLVGAHDAAAHAATFSERPADIDLGAIAVPRAHAQRGAASQLAGRLLAHQVDGRARIAHAGQQAGGALEHFDAVIDGHVAERVAGRVGRIARHRDAVVLEVLYRKAARVVLGALAVIGDDAHAGRDLHDVIDAVEAEVVHFLTGDHADRLRRLARTEHQAGGGGDRAGRVRITALGDGAELVGGDLHGLQGLCAVLGRCLARRHLFGLHGRRGQGQAQHAAHCLHQRGDRGISTTATRMDRGNTERNDGHGNASRQEGTPLAAAGGNEWAA